MVSVLSTTKVTILRIINLLSAIAFALDKYIFQEADRVENIVGKRENAG